MNGELNIEYIAESLRELAVPLNELNLDSINPRKHSARNLEAVKTSLDKFGQRVPIVVQKQGMIVRAGNARLQAARELGWTHIAAVIVEESDLEATAFAIADNRTAELAEWNDDVLSELLKELQLDESIDHLVTGFNESEFAELLEGPMEIKEEDIRQFQLAHVLISFPPQKLLDIQPYLEKIGQIEEVEIEHGSN